MKDNIRPNAGNYTIEDYAEDFRNIKDLPSQKRGAAVTAAKKRLRIGIVLRKLHHITDEYALDMTPSLALRIITGWLDRGISMRLLNEQFGTPDRTASDKSNDFTRVDEIVNEYRAHVLEEIATEFHTVHLLSSVK